MLLMYAPLPIIAPQTVDVRVVFRINEAPGIRLKKLTELAGQAELRNVLTVAQLATITPLVGREAHCSDERGGYVPVFGDGVNWRRVSDREIIS